MPAGLEQRMPLAILEWHQFLVKVRDEHRVQIDAGFPMYLDGWEFPESHPKCAADLRQKLEELEDFAGAWRIGSYGHRSTHNRQ